tara:strand:+ start:916 stop:1131 length:216 start_codon:yes stop_codon:yes gene_type:complete
MVKLTIDEIEYETDEFNEDQSKLLNEITYNSNIQKQLDYQIYTLKQVGDSLVANLNKTLQDKTKEKKAKPK